MRKCIILLCLLSFFLLPVQAMDYTAPEPPQDALELMPPSSGSFASDLVTVVLNAIGTLQPWLTDCLKICVGIFVTVLLVSVAKTIPGGGSNLAEFAGILSIAALLLQNTRSMIQLASDTILQLSQYGKLLLPVMAMAMASQGQVSTSAGLYAGTAVFNAVLCDGIVKILVPGVYVYLVLSLGSSATEQSMLKSLKETIQNGLTWILKVILFVFTGYMTITGVVSGSTDAVAMKATRLSISGMIPVVGSFLADASEAVIVGAGVMKNAVGIYGMTAILAIFAAPFLKMGILYLLLKITTAFCGIFETKQVSELLKSFTSAMGLLLAMVGSVCVMLLISGVCFLKGVA